MSQEYWRVMMNIPSDHPLCKAVVAGLIVTHLIRMGDVPVWICLNESLSEERSHWMMCG